MKCTHLNATVEFLEKDFHRFEEADLIPTLSTFFIFLVNILVAFEAGRGAGFGIRCGVYGEQTGGGLAGAD